MPYFVFADKMASPSSTRVKRPLFSPMNPHQATKASNRHDIRTELASVLRQDADQSCFVEFMDRKRADRQPGTQQTSVFAENDTFKLPDTLLEKATQLGGLPVEEALAILQQPISPDEVNAIKTVTSGQNMSAEWLEQRKGRITATKMKAVSTKMDTLSRSGNASGTDSLVKTIMGYSAAPTTVAMKHGRTQEAHAKLLYQKPLNKRHRCFSTQESGLLVMEQFPYIGATPDLFVQCQCHGEGLCEIKCPYTMRDQIPSSSSISYLCSTNNGDQLKTNHEYYFQIQGQMGVSGRHYCDFFVYTSSGYHLERIVFDEQFWQSLLSTLQRFWQCYVGPEVISQKMLHERPTCSHAPANDHNYSSDTPLPPRKAKASYRPVSVEDCDLPQFLCGLCQSFAGQRTVESLECSNCSVWWHFKCLGAEEGKAREERDVWWCPRCLYQGSQ